MEQEKGIGRGFAILSIAGIAVKLLSLLMVPILSNILGEAGYGVYGMTYQVFSFIYIIANSGFPVAISKYVSELSENKYHKAALRSFKIARAALLLIGFTFAFLMAVFSKPIASLMSTSAWLGILVLAPCVCFTSLLSAYRGYFQGRQQMYPTAMTQVVEQVINVVFSISLAALLIPKGVEQGVAGGAAGSSLGALAALLIIIPMLNKYIRNGFAVPGDNRHSPYSYKDLAKTLLKYSIPITICSAVQYGGNLVDAINTKSRLLVSGLLDEPANALYGQLHRSQQLINVPVSLIISLAVAMLPAIASSFAVNDRKTGIQKIRYSYRLCYIVAVPFALGLSVLHGGIFRILQFQNGSELLLYGGLTLILLATAQIQTSILQSLNRLYYAVVSLTIGIIIKIILNYYLIAIPSVQIYGAIIGTLVSMFVVVCINQAVINRKERIHVRIPALIWRPLSASIYMAAVVCILYYIPRKLAPALFYNYFSHLLLLIVSVLAGGMIYFIIMAKLKGLTKKDIQSISGKLYRLLPGFMKQMLS